MRGTIEESDEMIRSLDDCICEVETGTAIGFCGKMTHICPVYNVTFHYL